MHYRRAARHAATGAASQKQFAPDKTQRNRGCKGQNECANLRFPNRNGQSEDLLERIDLLIIGAGALGLALAARLAGPGRSVLIAEQAGLTGSHASSRNSEVIHAGIYYPPDSLKARLCQEGNQRLFAWCEQYHVPYRRIGKLLVAVNPGEQAQLEKLHANARACGVHHLQTLDARQLQRLEPALHASAGLLSPDTGILDSHTYLQSLLACAEQRGAQLVLHSRVDRLLRTANGWRAEGISQGEPFALDAALVINAAGAFAQTLAGATEGLAEAHVPHLHLCQGRYFSYSGGSPFSRLIYPLPEANSAGLGIHATLDLAGQLRFGPDVQYVDAIDYRVDERLRGAFADAIRRYLPGVQAHRLQPAYCGVRAKLSGPGEPPTDFVIQDSSTHGLPGLINLFGIESPGLTASLAIAEHIADRL